MVYLLAVFSKFFDSTRPIIWLLELSSLCALLGVLQRILPFFVAARCRRSRSVAHNVIVQNISISLSPQSGNKEVDNSKF
jgi:hypothetical protein